MYKSHLKARRGASQGGTPLAEIDSTSVESAWSVTPSLRQRPARPLTEPTQFTHRLSVNAVWQCGSRGSHAIQGWWRYPCREVPLLEALRLRRDGQRRGLRARQAGRASPPSATWGASQTVTRGSAGSEWATSPQARAPDILSALFCDGT